MKDYIDIWVLWATITILTDKDERVPPSSSKFGSLFDGTERLGERLFDNQSKGAGKTAHIAKITPRGAGKVISSGWEFQREKKGARWNNDVRWPYWEEWKDDTSQPRFLRTKPDRDDSSYDIDAPTIGGEIHSDTSEAYINFRQ